MNDAPHIGHAYTTVLADSFHRYYQTFGASSYFLTGTDEHGQKVSQAAQNNNITPKAQVDKGHIRFKELWQKLNINYDRFIRTTEKEHIEFVESCLDKLYQKGEIYAENYTGWYSIFEERFFSDDELINGKDPIGKRKVEWIEEKNYFFRMSQYQKQLLDYIEQNPYFILPEFRKNEVLGFLQKPLRDLCISRPCSRLNWGIPLPFDKEYVTYVWFDALLNYLSAIQKKLDIWPVKYHIIGKDILTTHAIYWPCMLFALDFPLPEHLLAHGWWLSQGNKLSKSSGVKIDPNQYIKNFGADSLRYFLVSSMPLGSDASFTDEIFIKKVNTDLANDLGNAINRVHKLIHKYFSQCLPVPGPPSQVEIDLQNHCTKQIQVVKQAVEKGRLEHASEGAMSIVKKCNQYIEEKAPWQLAKNKEEIKDKTDLANSLYYSIESLRIALCLLYPIIPEKAKIGLGILGQQEAPKKEDLEWGKLKGKEKLNDTVSLFPRI